MARFVSCLHVCFVTSVSLVISRIICPSSLCPCVFLFIIPFLIIPFFALKKGLDQITLKEQMLALLPLALTEIIYALATGILLLNPQ